MFSAGRLASGSIILYVYAASGEYLDQVLLCRNSEYPNTEYPKTEVIAAAYGVPGKQAVKGETWYLLIFAG